MTNPHWLYYSFKGLYRIYFFQTGRPDFEWQIRLQQDFQIDCNLINLMCKKIMNVRVIWVFDYFLCSSYRYIIYMHSHSTLCHSNVSSTYYVSKKCLNNLTSKIPQTVFICQTSKNKLKIVYFSNPAKLSGSGGIFARARFVQDLEKCRIPTKAEMW